jgi:membrane protein required for colicin V production
MNGFDWTLVGVVALSLLLAYVRGVTRELIALVAWVVGFLAALAFSPMLGRMLPTFGANPAIPYLIAFVAILIGTLVLGALIAWPLGNFIRKAGLGFVDRFLGAVFGVVRGLALVVAFALVAGLTDLPREDWWQNARLARPLAMAALALAPWLPPEWAHGLDFSREGRKLRPDPAERKA